MVLVKEWKDIERAIIRAACALEEIRDELRILDKKIFQSAEDILHDECANYKQKEG